MTSVAALSCPRCRRTLGVASWSDAQQGTCAHCQARFEFMAFPALQATRAQIAPQAAAIEADSVCFFHAENRAEAICDRCGRLLCPVCSVPFAGEKLCPSCISSTRVSQDPGVTRERVLYDSLALAIAGLPLLIWPFTLVTAPIALGMVFYGWKKPSSLVRGRSRTRLIIAAVLAVGQIGAWATFGGILWLKH